ncbi:MAG: response regulator [Oscillospiraceae bacterium]|jgi:PleD family two-component response regulator|nr:response regulator [Oscillospiraceae bacterium]
MNSKSYKILVVDDEKHNIDVLNDILSPVYDVMIAKDGATAVKMAKELMPDLILLDVVMPEASGFNVIATLKNSDLTKHIPVIFVTSLDDYKYEEKGLELGAVDYITKPFRNAIVMARVKTQLKMVDYIRTIERMADALKSELAYVVEELVNIKEQNFNSQKKETAEEKVNQISTEEAADILQKLEPLLKSGSSKAVQLADRLRGVAGTEAIIELIEDYDFMKAFKTLNKLRRIYGEREML